MTSINISQRQLIAQRIRISKRLIEKLLADQKRYHGRVSWISMSLLQGFKSHLENVIHFKWPIILFMFEWLNSTSDFTSRLKLKKISDKHDNWFTLDQFDKEIFAMHTRLLKL